MAHRNIPLSPTTIASQIFHNIFLDKGTTTQTYDPEPASADSSIPQSAWNGTLRSERLTLERTQVFVRKYSGEDLT